MSGVILGRVYARSPEAEVSNNRAGDGRVRRRVSRMSCSVGQYGDEPDHGTTGRRLGRANRSTVTALAGSLATCFQREISAILSAPVGAEKSQSSVAAGSCCSSRQPNQSLYTHIIIVVVIAGRRFYSFDVHIIHHTRAPLNTGHRLSCSLQFPRNIEDVMGPTRVLTLETGHSLTCIEVLIE